MTVPTTQGTIVTNHLGNIGIISGHPPYGCDRGQVGVQWAFASFVVAEWPHELWVPSAEDVHAFADKLP